MNYRISTYVLAALLAGAVVYNFIDHNQSGRNPGSSTNDTVCCEEVDPALIRFWKKKGKKIDPDSTGEFISEKVAKEHFLRYQNSKHCKNQPYGFVFGINRVRKLISNIDSVNRKWPDAADTNRIAGIRVYLVKRFTDIPNVGKRKHLDVMLVTTRKSGHNFISIGDVHGDKSRDFTLPPPDEPSPLILDTSSPCPDMCD